MLGFLIFHMRTVGSYQTDQTPSSQIEFVPPGHTLYFLSNVYAYLHTNNGLSQLAARFPSILNYLICLPHCISNLLHIFR